MSRTGIHSRPTTAARTKTEAAVGQAWSMTAVVCPACGLVAVEHVDRPRFTCSDRRCEFFNGWVIRPTDDLQPIVVYEQVDDGDGHLVMKHVNRDSQVCVAVPLDGAGEALPDASVRWPRRSS